MAQKHIGATEFLKGIEVKRNFYKGIEVKDSGFCLCCFCRGLGRGGTERICRPAGGMAATAISGESLATASTAPPALRARIEEAGRGHLVVGSQFTGAATSYCRAPQAGIPDPSESRRGTACLGSRLQLHPLLPPPQ